MRDEALSLMQQTRDAMIAATQNAEREGRELARRAFPLRKAVAHGLLKHPVLMAGMAYDLCAVWWEGEDGELLVEWEGPGGAYAVLPLEEALGLWGENLLIAVV
jgi:hypothetical protein